MRIATWNLDHHRRGPDARSGAWKYLASTIQPDVALLQETVPPQDAGADVIYRKGGIGERRAWGSAVVSFGPEIEEITEHGNRVTNYNAVDLLGTHPGCVAIAEVRPPDVEPVVVISVYGLIDHGYAITTMHRILSDLTPLIDSPRGKRLVLGGDLNSSTQLEPPYREWHRNLFERMRLLGLVDVIDVTANERPRLEDCPCKEDVCTHVQTHRHSTSKKPWHDDYLFASQTFAKRLERCEVVDGGSPSAWDHSDHCPVVAEFAA